MDNTIEVVVEDDLWNAFDLEAIAIRSFDAVAAKLDLKTGPYELDILACDDSRIAVLNSEFRGKPTPTNVLSWPGFDLAPERSGETPNLPPVTEFGDPYVHIGDIAIAYQTCLKEANDAEIDPLHHITHLIIHGILHLLGYDHETDANAELMESIETDLLTRFGIGNPYENV